MRFNPSDGDAQLVSIEPPGMSDKAARAESAAFRHAMRDLAAGVAVVACGAGAARVGCTVTSLTSLSLSPPTLIVSISRSSSTLGRLREAGAFGVSLLAARHEGLANRFAGRDGAFGAHRFEGESWTTLATGAPLLADALAGFDCRLEELIERHTHAIAIGAVAAVREGPRAPALVHWRGGFCGLE